MQKGGSNDHWSQERAKYFQRGGLSEEVVNDIVKKGGSAIKTIRFTQESAFEQVKLARLARLRYNLIRSVTLPLYLRHCPLFKLISRFRCENEEWGRERWRDYRMCRVCGREEETLEHQAADCAPFIGSVRRLLDERGRGADDMKKIIEMRK